MLLLFYLTVTYTSIDSLSVKTDLTISPELVEGFATDPSFTNT